MVKKLRLRKEVKELLEDLLIDALGLIAMLGLAELLILISMI